MRSFEIFVEPEQSKTKAAWTPEAEAAPSPPSGRRASPSEVLDLFIQGANVTARVAERHASCVLRDLAWALGDLLPLARGKRIVRFYDDAWELCVERLGARATLSVYRGGAAPTVIVYDREVVFAEMCESVVDAIGATLERPHREGVGAELAAARARLESARPSWDTEAAEAPGAQTVAVDAERDAPISFATEFAMRPGARFDSEPNVERTDLHALLVRGKTRAEVRGRGVDLGEIYPFLFAERILELSRRALDTWERGQAFFTRLEAGGAMIGLRVVADDVPKATLTTNMASGGRMVATFPELSLFDVVEAALAFGRALVRAIVRRDRSQAGNLRLAAFRRDMRATADMLREVRRSDARINPAPESYRAFAQHLRARADGPALAGGRLKYTPRWRALVPGIDLRATFLCGEKVIIGGATETYCLERTTGSLMWRRSTPRAASVVTPFGIARVSPDGAIAIHDFATGDVTLRTWIAPRVSGPSAGAVVNTPGLPRLLVLPEGERHLVAIDLTSGEARWRYTGGRGGTLRLKRAGRLLYVGSGDSALTAVDVQTGSVVWRVRDRLRFVAPPTVDHEQLFAVAGGSGSAATLHAIDPYSGKIGWSAKLPFSPCSIEGVPLRAGRSITVAVRDRRGLRMASFDRSTGEPLFTTETPVAPVGTSWLGVDDMLVGNTPLGEALAVDATSGVVRWRHSLGRAADSDLPRKLEPVLRNGALFVPCVDVHVLRPSDGAQLATVGPCDAIPDLLRVDERCDVYVAEESGHMVAFGAGPRLSLVK